MSTPGFRERGSPGHPLPTAPSADATSDDEAGIEEPSWYVCVACGQKVTRDSWLRGAGERGPLVFSNPRGLVFELLLVERAVGVVVTPEATSDHTWFAGYAWRVAFCRSCGSHLGWEYEAIESGRFPAYFIGLSRSAVKFMNGS